MKVTPVSDVLDAEITGIDLAQPPDLDTRTTLRRALYEFQVLVIKEQNLSPLQQVTFSSNWGDLEIPDNVKYTVKESNNMMVLSNEMRPDGRVAERDNVIQPLVLVHPETARKELHCSPHFTIGIKGMSEEEVDPILHELFSNITDRTRPYYYRHQYREWDLVMWKNRCLCHRAVGGYGLPVIRCMHRTVVGGDRAFADQQAA